MASFNPFQVLEGGDQSASPSEDLTACFAKIHKKDLTSKLKGFQDLFAWIKTADDISVLSHEFVLSLLSFAITYGVGSYIQ